jgi:hypothetical protein
MEAIWFLVDPAEPRDVYAAIPNERQEPQEEQKK